MNIVHTSLVVGMKVHPLRTSACCSLILFMPYVFKNSHVLMYHFNMKSLFLHKLIFFCITP